MNPVQRHPWVIMCFFSMSVGFWLMLWTGLEGWWLPFGIVAFGFANGAAGVFLWLRTVGGPPKMSDYLTLVKTLRKLWP
jgi:hypothetical protein